MFAIFRSSLVSVLKINKVKAKSSKNKVCLQKNPQKLMRVFPPFNNVSGL